jgi:uncharacterized protein HemX
LIVLVLLALALGGGVYYTVQNVDTLFAEMRTQMREGTRQQLEKLEAGGKVPEEHRALYDDLKARLLSDETSVLALMAVQESVHEALSDETLDATEIAMLEAAANFLRRYPRPTLQEWLAFGEVHDSIRRGVERPSNGIDVDGEKPEAEVAE